MLLVQSADHPRIERKISAHGSPGRARCDARPNGKVVWQGVAADRLILSMNPASPLQSVTRSNPSRWRVITTPRAAHHLLPSRGSAYAGSQELPTG